ncbi:CAP domain-containing protein [Dactylosporangium aurantiacum]|uniref:CAP domain-containing protein n=1 Tax=Dactylosporangium aurantiacum TaxID=35754 RepID=UPI000A76AE70|nr:CAP domain-containing protein [Dactylosporangium aurantiacum]MDG6107529.1 CAP domain-containing protein [Dactylosporangium aurantiacum]
MTRFPRRATVLAALLLAAPLGFTITATAATAAPAAVQAVSAAGDAVAGADVAAAVSKKKKKKKKKTTAKKPATTPTTKPTTPTTAPTAPAAKPVESSSFETEVVTLTNNYRTANGCGALRIDSRLVAAARAHSTDMVTNGFFSHTGSNGSTFVQREVAAGYTTGASAENIAWGYRSPQEVVNGWINSAGHRANILNCGSVAVGVGVAYKADGTPYWTQDFGRV